MTLDEQIAKLEAELELVFEREQLGYPTRRSSKVIRAELFALYAQQDRAEHVTDS